MMPLPVQLVTPMMLLQEQLEMRMMQLQTQ
jgi:hypothetical protein